MYKIKMGIFNPPGKRTGNTSDKQHNKGLYLHMETGISRKLKKRALIVDDDAEILKVISYWMTSREWDVTTASDGTEAFDRMSEGKNFQLILTDLNMPHMDGLTLAEKIKNIFPLVRIILVTGASSDAIEQENKIAYVDDVLYKPFSLKELDRVVDLSMSEENNNHLSN